MKIIEQLKKYINPDVIVLNLKPGTKAEVLSQIIDPLYQLSPDSAGLVSKPVAFSAIMDRENLQSTAVGEGKAFPHARIDGWAKFAVCVGYSAQGLDFDSIDGRPVHFICVMFSSKEDPYLILKAMSSIIKFMAELEKPGASIDDWPKLERSSLSLQNKQETTRIVLAHEIMMPLKIIVGIDDPLSEVVRLMHLEKIDVLPVVDENKKLKGQISCYDIFSHEVPEFFRQLHTVSFVRNFDPFENYFKLKKDLKVRDYLKNGCVTIDYKSTLVEIIFLLGIKGNPRLFVIQDEKLVGIIDQFSVLDRILFF
ncbi:MAG: PTS sugar transporter subunit IIA [Candidatus Omnitrophica bacterium]|nr:PTS sugar transporter subunit IIA [Candidatus Omnitrophota bacterium]